MTAAAIAPRAARLADLEAAPVLALLDLVGRSPEQLAAVQISPGPTDGRVVVEAACSAVMARLEVDGDAEHPICLPRGPLLVLRRRHPEAERLVLDQLDTGVGMRTFGPDTTVAITSPRAEPLPPLPFVPLPERPAAGDRLPLLLDPVLLGKGLGVLARLGCGTVALTVLDHPVVGAALVARPGPGSAVAGAIQLARCQLQEAS